MRGLIGRLDRFLQQRYEDGGDYIRDLHTQEERQNKWSIDLDDLLGTSAEISFGRTLLKQHGAPAMVVTENRILFRTARRGIKKLDILGLEEVLIREALDLDSISIRTNYSTYSVILYDTF
jgi:hypothetical protein